MRDLPVIVAALLLAVSLAACSTGNADVRTSPSSSDETAIHGSLGSTGCKPASPLAGNEIAGTPDGAVTSAFGQFQGVDPAQLRADSETIKLVIRLDGVGDLQAQLLSPSGDERALDWGPEAHLSSNYERPGDEWGTGFSFDVSGCWQLLAQRDNGSASFWLDVAP